MRDTISVAGVLSVLDVLSVFELEAFDFKDRRPTVEADDFFIVPDAGVDILESNPMAILVGIFINLRWTDQLPLLKI